MTTSISSKDNSFSQEECIIFTDNENWRIRYKEFDHKLEVAVAGSSNLKETMQSLHDSLSEICRSSHLEGLNYCGGILKTHCKCGPQTLHYATFEDGKPSKIQEDNVRCTTCKQPIKDEQRIPMEDNSVSGKRINRAEPCKESTELKHGDVFRMLCSASAMWYEIGTMLDVGHNMLLNIKKDSDSVNEKLGAVINHWLSNSNNTSWKELAIVMRSELVNRNDIKSKIMELHCNY